MPINSHFRATPTRVLSIQSLTGNATCRHGTMFLIPKRSKRSGPMSSGVSPRTEASIGQHHQSAPAGAFLLVVVTATIAKIANRAQGESDAHPCACATAPVRTCPSGETALVAFPGRLDRHSIIRQARRVGGKFP